MNGNHFILILISLQFILGSPIDSKVSLVHESGSGLSPNLFGDKPLPDSWTNDTWLFNDDLINP